MRYLNTTGRLSAAYVRHYTQTQRIRSRWFGVADVRDRQTDRQRQRQLSIGYFSV